MMFPVSALWRGKQGVSELQTGFFSFSGTKFTSIWSTTLWNTAIN